MSFPMSNKDREQSKFIQSPTRPNDAAVEVVAQGPFDVPATADTITRQVSGAQEIYRYYTGGAGGTLLRTITVTYVNSSLKDLVSVEVT